jgi:hypothetical protein
LIFDFHTVIVAVLKDEHTVVAFEIVKDDNHVSVIVVLAPGYVIEMVEQLGSAIESVEGLWLVGLVGFQTNQNGGLIVFFVGEGLVIAVDLQRWVSSNPAIVRVLFVYSVGTCSHVVDGDLFFFGIVFIFFETLDVTLVIG